MKITSTIHAISMKTNQTAIKVAVITVLSFALVSCMQRGSYFSSGISEYKGDGRIEDTSQAGGAYPSRGFIVALPAFKLNEPFTKTFQLDGLPIIEGQKVGVYFNVPKLMQQSDGVGGNASIELCVLSAEGEELTTAKGPLSGFVWSTPVHGYQGQALYKQNGSFFIAKPGIKYRLKIVYSPADMMSQAEGQVYLWCSAGGS